jgi:hypothetical protein
MSSRFYDDAQFTTLFTDVLPPSGVQIVIATAGTSATVLNPNAFVAPYFVRPTVLTGFKVYTITAPAVTPGTLGLMNGTNTVATVVVPAAGTESLGTLTGSASGYTTFTANSQATVQYQGTASATTVLGGVYGVTLEWQEQYN